MLYFLRVLKFDLFLLINKLINLADNHRVIDAQQQLQAELFMLLLYLLIIL